MDRSTNVWQTHILNDKTSLLSSFEYCADMKWKILSYGQIELFRFTPPQIISNNKSKSKSSRFHRIDVDDHSHSDI